MALLDTVLFGFVAALLTFKVLLLATATMLLVFGLTQRNRKQASAKRQVAGKAHRLDVYA